MLRVGTRYFMNLVARVAQQRGFLAAIFVGVKFVFSEVIKLPRLVWLYLFKRAGDQQPQNTIVTDSVKIATALANLGVEFKEYQVDADAFSAHVTRYEYPRNYAAGPMDGGGMREQKLLEYFVSLDMIDLQPTDTVVDVASEWSLFPDVVRKLSGATVYQQDIIYPPGINNDQIGGNAANMPVPDNFADKLVLHNAFEHFEGTSDTDFIIEAWRVLKPGGILCIVPLFMAEEPAILTDPLVNRHGITWDPEAQVIEKYWWHNRFGRFYDPVSLEKRVLTPGKNFHTTLYHITNLQDIHPRTYLHFALIMRKPNNV